MNIAKWMDELDEVCLSDLEMKIHDLPHHSFLNAYEEGYTPEQFLIGQGYRSTLQVPIVRGGLR